MRITTYKFTKNDLAKHPFLKEVTDYVKTLDLRVEDLAGSSFSKVLERAEERVEEAILYTLTGNKERNDEVEILSFPVAIMLVIATANSFIKKRYALAEAKQSYNDLRFESGGKLLAVAQNFGWQLVGNDRAGTLADFSLPFHDYIRNTTHLRDSKWKLVNRSLSNGNVHLTRNETARLLSEEVRKHVEKRLEVTDVPAFPAKITEIAEKVKRLSMEKIGETEMDDFPRVFVQSAFPPCISSLYQAFTSGRHLSHVGRFTLTSFLLNAGMPSEKVVELFRNFSDFNERMTRYQVEHIAGEKGSRTRYIPPKCDTLRTHGVCTGSDDLCQRVSHPLSYYRRKLKAS